MSPTRLFFIAVILYTSVAHAEKPCTGPFKGAKPDQQTLAKVIADHQGWVFAHFERLMGRKQPPSGARAELCGAGLRGRNFANGDLSEASLSYADLRGANLRQAFLVGADFAGANLSGADLTGAILRMADFSGADLSGADLKDAKLGGANFSSAKMNGANLFGASLFGGDRREKTDLRAINLLGGDVERVVLAIPNLQGADMDGVLFEPKSGKLAALTNIHLAVNLQGMTFKDSSAALYALRKVFQKAGYRRQQRQITFAIRHAQRQQAPFLESAYEYVAFEAPVAWGLAPGRALLICGVLAIVFFAAYAITLITPGKAGFMKGGARVVYSGPGSLALPLLFSFMSVIQVNWGGPELCRKVMNVVGGEQGLKVHGWVRPVSWVQSGLSLYLIIMWFLSAFGRPFE